MNIICTIKCDRCGDSPQCDPNGIDLFIIDGDVIAVARCPQCEHPITVWVSKERALTIFKKGVKAFSFDGFEEVDLENV